MHSLHIDLDSLLGMRISKTKANNWGSLSTEQWEAIQDELSFRPSKDGKIYISIQVSTAFATIEYVQPRGAIVAASGDVRYLAIPFSEGVEMFRFVVGNGRMFALFGARDETGRSGRFDDLQELVVGPENDLKVEGRYKVASAPDCVSGDHLFGIRPDGKGSGGTYLIVYQLP